jgi:hypothetical protein
VAVGVTVAVTVAVGVGTGVAVGVTTGVGVRVGVTTGVGVWVGVAVGVGVTAGVDVSVGVGVTTGVGVAVGVTAGVGVGVEVASHVTVIGLPSTWPSPLIDADTWHEPGASDVNTSFATPSLPVTLVVVCSVNMSHNVQLTLTPGTFTPVAEVTCASTSTVCPTGTPAAGSVSEESSGTNVKDAWAAAGTANGTSTDTPFIPGLFTTRSYVPAREVTTWAVAVPDAPVVT